MDGWHNRSSRSERLGEGSVDTGSGSRLGTLPGLRIDPAHVGVPIVLGWVETVGPRLRLSRGVDTGTVIFVSEQMSRRTLALEDPMGIDYTARATREWLELRPDVDPAVLVLAGCLQLAVTPRQPSSTHRLTEPRTATCASRSSTPASDQLLTGQTSTAASTASTASTASNGIPPSRWLHKLNVFGAADLGPPPQTYRKGTSSCRSPLSSFRTQT